MDEDIPLPFDLPAVARKKVSAAFDGGRITSDGGVMLLTQAEQRLGIADLLARVIPDERDVDRVVHLLPDIQLITTALFALASAVTIGPVLLVYRIAKHTLWLLAPALLYTTVVVGAWNGFASGFDAIRLEAIKHNYADAYALEHMTPRGRSLTCDDKRIELTADANAIC